ncbi:MAG TPA: LytTR family DNA-binding domain-containing protein [Bacillota bacterium]|nr:LytTR family DNA-binding domain-containing protein [Bacillota bacterium]
MKIRVEEIEQTDEIEVIIKGSKDNEDVKEIYRSLLYFESVILGKTNDKTVSLPLSQIYYFDSVDNKTFAYDKNTVYDVNLKLYQLEEKLVNTPFIRVNKSMIVNTRKLKTFKSTINGRMEATLINGEKVKISRSYVPLLKEKLGGKR